MPRLIPLDRQVRMPWRNGQGETRELASWPAGSTLDTFHWRVSVATVTQDGAFSRFPGMTRLMALVGGAGLRVTGAGVAIELDQPYAVAAYRGAEVVQCELLGGVVQVLNLMVREGTPASIRALTALTAHARSASPARFHVIHATRGGVECRMQDTSITLHEGDALQADSEEDGPAPLQVRPLEHGAVALVCDIDLMHTA